MQHDDDDVRHLDGERLSELLEIHLWQRFDMRTAWYDATDNKWHDQVFKHLVITPLGVAAVCADNTGIFEANRGREILAGTGKLVKVYGYIDPSMVRFNADWLHELADRSGIQVNTVNNGTVGAMEVRALSFLDPVASARAGITPVQTEASQSDPEDVDEVIVVDRPAVIVALRDAIRKKNSDRRKLPGDLKSACSSYYSGWEDALKFIADKLGLDVH